MFCGSCSFTIDVPESDSVACKIDWSATLRRTEEAQTAGLYLYNSKVKRSIDAINEEEERCTATNAQKEKKVLAASEETKKA